MQKSEVGSWGSGAEGAALLIQAQGVGSATPWVNRLKYPFM